MPEQCSGWPPGGSSPAIVSENNTLSPFLHLLGFSQFDLWCHHLAQPWSSQPKHRHKPLSLFPLKNEGHPYQLPETTHSTLSACWNPTHPLRSISPATSPGLSQLGMSSLTPVPQVIWSILVCSSSHFDLHVVINVCVPFGRLLENPLNGAKGLPDAKWAVTIVSVQGMQREMSTFWKISCLSVVSKKSYGVSNVLEFCLWAW